MKLEILCAGSQIILESNADIFIFMLFLAMQGTLLLTMESLPLSCTFFVHVHIFNNVFFHLKDVF